MTALLQRLHARLGDFWWYSLLLFAALRVGDVINAVVGLWLVPKYVGQEELGAVLPLTQFATSVGAPMTILVTVFTKFLNKFKTLGEEGKVKSMLLWFVGIAVALVIATSAIAITILPHFFERIRVTSGSLVTLIIASGLIGTLTPVFTNALQGLKKFKTITLINLFSAPIRLATMLVTMPIRALSGYLVGQTAPQLFSIAASCFALRKHIRRDIKAVPFWRSDGRDIARYAGLVTVWIGIGALCAPVTFMVIRQRLPEVESSAYYMLTRFAELATFAGQTLLVLLFPLASEANTKGKSSFKYLLYADLGSVCFGIVTTAALYFLGPVLFDLIPTCRPYASYMTDLTLLSVSMVLGLVWANFTTHEMARGNFWYLAYASPMTVLQAAFLVCFTGYTFFEGILPHNVIVWMASLKVNTLRGFIWSTLWFNLVRIVLSRLDRLNRNLRMRHQLRNSDRAARHAIPDNHSAPFLDCFSKGRLSCNWFNIADPTIILNLPAVVIGQPPAKLADRHAIKAAFKGFGIVTNESDGLQVTFPAASAGKMHYQSGTDIRAIASAFKMLFEKSHRAWDEHEVRTPGHTFHFNVTSYSNYICRFRLDCCEYFIRFTTRKIGHDTSVLASTVSEVAFYRKTEGIPADSHLENPEDGQRMPFIDSKISYYLSVCQ